MTDLNREAYFVIDMIRFDRRRLAREALRMRREAEDIRNPVLVAACRKSVREHVRTMKPPYARIRVTPDALRAEARDKEAFASSPIPKWETGERREQSAALRARCAHRAKVLRLAARHLAAGAADDRYGRIIRRYRGVVRGINRALLADARARARA